MESPTTSQTDMYALPFREWLNDSHAFVAGSKPTISLYDTEFLLSICNGDNVLEFYFNVNDSNSRDEALRTLTILRDAIFSLEQSILELKLPAGG